MIYRHSRLVMVHKQPEGLFPCISPWKSPCFSCSILKFSNFYFPKHSQTKSSTCFRTSLSLNCQQLQVIHVLLEKNRGASVALSPMDWCSSKTIQNPYISHRFGHFSKCHTSYSDTSPWTPVPLGRRRWRTIPGPHRARRRRCRAARSGRAWGDGRGWTTNLGWASVIWVIWVIFLECRWYKTHFRDLRWGDSWLVTGLVTGFLCFFFLTPQKCQWNNPFTS